MNSFAGEMYASGDGCIDIHLIQEDKLCIFIICGPKFLYTCSHVTHAYLYKHVWHENNRESSRREKSGVQGGISGVERKSRYDQSSLHA